MRFAVLLAPAAILLAGAGYFQLHPTQYAATVSAASPAAVERDKDPAPSDDDRDGEIVRHGLDASDLTEAEASTLFVAAGRRYMRRKLAWQAAEGGQSAPEKLESLRREMELARKVCDLADSLGRRARELSEFARADQEMERRLLYAPSTVLGLADRFEGTTAFSEGDLRTMESAFQKRFGRSLPVSARGASAVHRSMGFDHRGRFDVAVSPEQLEGVWVRQYLTAKNVPFFAFRSAVRGKATGAHIHIGPASGRRLPSD